MLPNEFYHALQYAATRGLLQRIVDKVAPIVISIVSEEYPEKKWSIDRCDVCKQWKENVRQIGFGKMCRLCEENMTIRANNSFTITEKVLVKGIPVKKERLIVKFPYSAILVHIPEVGNMQKVCHVYGETISDLWANASAEAAKKGYKIFRDSIFQKSPEAKRPYLALSARGKFMSNNLVRQ